MRMWISSRSAASVTARLLQQRVDQIGPALGAGVEPLQRHQRRRVLGLDALRPAEVLDRLLRLLQLLVVRDRDHQQQLALQRRRQLLLALGRSAFSYSATSCCHLSMMVARRSSSLRAGRRRRVLLERAGVGVERLVAVADLALQLADPQQQRHALVGFFSCAS